MLCRLTSISRRFPYYKTQNNPRQCSYQVANLASLHLLSRQFSSRGADEPYISPSADIQKAGIKFAEVLHATTKSQRAYSYSYERVHN